jgi:hypothetical protein
LNLSVRFPLKKEVLQIQFLLVVAFFFSSSFFLLIIMLGNLPIVCFFFKGNPPSTSPIKIEKKENKESIYLFQYEAQYTKLCGL